MWAEDRGILKSENAKTQCLKTMSELGELSDAIIKQNPDDQKDAIGDVLVCLIILAHDLGFDIEDCLESAFNEIKDRKGKVVGGNFVKD